MILYSINDKGELIKLNKLEFTANDMYLVDDEYTIYLWIGLNIPLNKKDLSAKVARNLNKERGGSAKILLMDQNREYGTFLAMMENLRKGLRPDVTIERRPELILEPPSKPNNLKAKSDNKMEEDIVRWLEQIRKYRKFGIERITEEPKKVSDDELKGMIEVAAFFLSQNQLSYNDLCWFLAEIQLIIQKGDENVTEDDIRKKAEEVFRSSVNYDELCWLIAELKILVEQGYLEIG